MLLGALLLLGGKRRPAPAAAAAPAAAPPGLRVYIASIADDAPDVVRVIASPGNGTLRLMGIFQTEANAREVIARQGWELVSPDVQLMDRSP